MIDEFAKEYLHDDLRDRRATMLWKLEGLAEYDVRRPLTPTGTSLLGLVKHLTITEAWYFGEVFGRPFPERLPWRDDDADERTDDAKLTALFTHKSKLADMWATEDEPRVEIVDRYRRMWEHSDATIAALDIDAPGHVSWWPRPDVKLFNILVHVLNETNRHAGHADILREQLDGAVGTEAGGLALHGREVTFWEEHRAKIEQAAKAAARVGKTVTMGLTGGPPSDDTVRRRTWVRGRQRDDSNPSWKRGIFHRNEPSSEIPRSDEFRSRPSRVLHRMGQLSAHAGAGLLAAAFVLGWAAYGLVIGFPQWWETVLYSVSASVTLVMVFVLQHMQSRLESATQRKLDELLRSTPRADNQLIGVEEASDAELQVLTELNRADRSQARASDDLDR